MRYRATTANQVLFENVVLHYLADYYNHKLFFGSKCRKKLLPSPAWGAYSAPADPLVGFKGLFRGREGQDRDKIREVKDGVISLAPIPGSATAFYCLLKNRSWKNSDRVTINGVAKYR